MTIEKIRRAADVRPFRPFRIEMTSGQSYEVPGPEYLYFPPDPRIFVVACRDAAVCILDPLHVVKLSVEPVRTDAPAE